MKRNFAWTETPVRISFPEQSSGIVRMEIVSPIQSHSYRD